ncbi:hypothetical protein [Burkholderia gladioli]|uniref:hypothetical protein n=1 Tax=Burkholderia gladioli TaxID=28095 RepID=UPI001FC804BA|nr:hypothetical protein [Burkholderia gladioli]MDC6126836.1 hypothetical protein [Burkholderia gladioli]
MHRHRVMRHPIPLQGPLPEHERRALQLRHHLALARLLDRCHDPVPLGVLANVIRLAQALRGIASMPSLAACCRRADLALQRSFARGAPYRLDRAARDALEPLLALHDAQLAAVTVGAYLGAWRDMREAQSVIPYSQSPNLDTPIDTRARHLNRRFDLISTTLNGRRN